MHLTSLFYLKKKKINELFLLVFFLSCLSETFKTNQNPKENPYWPTDLKNLDEKFYWSKVLDFCQMFVNSKNKSKILEKKAIG